MFLGFTARIGSVLIARPKDTSFIVHFSHKRVP